MNFTSPPLPYSRDFQKWCFLFKIEQCNMKTTGSLAPLRIGKTSKIIR